MIQKRVALVIAPLTPTQMFLSIITHLFTQLLREQESLAVNLVRRFPRCGEANSIAFEYFIRIAGMRQQEFDYSRLMKKRSINTTI
jgi:hypothetical protein